MAEQTASKSIDDSNVIPFTLALQLIMVNGTKIMMNADFLA
ncbi:MAG: hypothetical protein AB8G22_16180 [Saprospiraceae bacterium]